MPLQHPRLWESALIGFCIFWGGSSLAHAKSASLLVKVALYPTGSFEVTSKTWNGKGAKKGELFSAQELKVPISSLTTGISLRDDHMREKLNASKYPDIIVREVKATGGKGSAKITINGVTKAITYSYEDLGNGFARAQFPLSLPDFKVEGLSYKGVGVEDDIEVIATVGYDGN